MTDIGSADRILTGGRIHTLAGGRNARVEALAVRAGRIVGVGSQNDMASLRGKMTEVVDIDGATVLPGFIETHMHPVTYGIQEQQIVVPDEAGSIPEVISIIGRQMRNLPPGADVLAWRFDHAAMAEHRHITATDLIPLGDTHPVVVRHVSGHVAYANEVVLRDHGIDASTPDPPGGEIVRDANGDPTGQFNELTAMDLVTGILPNLDAAGNRRGLAIAQESALAAGVTTVHDMGVWSDDYYAAYAGALDAGELRLRMRLYVFTPDLDDSPVPPDLSGDRCAFGGVKFAVDGMLHGETAYVRRPYLGAEGSGVLLQSPEELLEAVADAHIRGHQLAIHAEGDAALDIALDAIEHALDAMPRPDHRHRVEHVELVHPDQVERMQRLGVAASMLLNGINRWGDQLRSELGSERMNAVSPLRSLAAAGVPTALHSDCPITPLEPLQSVATAVLRKSRWGSTIGADEAVDVATAIRAVTAEAAYLGFEEADKGTLEVGKLADLVVLSADPFQIPPSEIPEIDVLATVVGGEAEWALDRAP